MSMNENGKSRLFKRVLKMVGSQGILKRMLRGNLEYFGYAKSSPHRGEGGGVEQDIKTNYFIL